MKVCNEPNSIHSRKEKELVKKEEKLSKIEKELDKREEVSGMQEKLFFIMF